MLYVDSLYTEETARGLAAGAALIGGGGILSALSAVSPPLAPAGSVPASKIE